MTEPGEEKQKKLIIEGNWIRLDRKGAEDKPATSREWQLIRALLTGEPVHWSDGFVIFDSWRNGRQKESYRDQFWRIQSKVPEKLQAKPYGILVKMDHPRGKPEWWKFLPRGEQVLESNIKDAVNLAQESQRKFLVGDHNTGWALVRKSYDKYPDAKSICQALATADSLPKATGSYEKCLRSIKELLENHKNVLSHALFKLLCLASPERQGVTVETVECALERWLDELHQVRQVLLLISGHSFSKPAASTVAIEEFAHLVEKYRECIDYVAELKRKCRDGNQDVEKELGLAEDEVADFLQRLLNCDAVDKVVEDTIAYYKDQPHRHIDDQMVIEHKMTAVSAFLERSDLLLDNPNALYSQFRICFTRSVDTFDRKDGIINLVKSDRNADEKWGQFWHILESAEDAEEAKKELGRLFGITVQQLARPYESTPILTGVVSPEKDLYRLLTVEEVLETKNPPPARWFREGGQVYSDFKQEKFYRRPEAEAVEKKILSNRFFLLEGEAATAKTTIVRTIMYDLHEARERKIYYFDVARRRSFDEDLLIRSIRSVPGLFIIENVHLEPRKVQWIYERFEKDPDRRFLLTWRRPDKEFQDPEAKKLYEIPKLTLEPFTEVDRLIDSYCSDPDTPAVVRQKCQDILNISKKDFWLLVCALQGCGDTHGQGDPLSWIANKVETRLVGLETCDDPHADQYPEIIVALSALYKNEVLTAKSYLKKLGFSRAALNGLVRRGEITWQEGPNNNIFYGLHHSTLADAYWEHGGKYIEDAKLQDYEEFIYQYAMSSAPNGLVAILQGGARGTADVTNSLLRRLGAEGKLETIVKNETSMAAIAHWQEIYYRQYPMDKGLLKVLADKITTHDDFFSAGDCLTPLCGLPSGHGLRLWKLVDRERLADRISSTDSFYGANNLISQIGMVNKAAASEFCSLLNLENMAANIEASSDPEDACEMASLVFRADHGKGKRLWGLVDRTKLASNLATRDTGDICFGLGELFRECDEAGWELWRSLGHERLSVRLKAIDDVYDLTTCIKNFFQVYDDLDLDVGGLLDLREWSGRWPLWGRAGQEFYEMLDLKGIVSMLAKSDDPEEDVTLIAVVCGTNPAAGLELIESLDMYRLLEVMQRVSSNPAMYGYISKICLMFDPEDLMLQFLEMIDEKELANRISNTRIIFGEDKCIETIRMMCPDAAEHLCGLLNVELLTRNLDDGRDSDSTRNFVKTIESANPEVGRRLHRLLYGG